MIIVQNLSTVCAWHIYNTRCSPITSHQETLWRTRLFLVNLIRYTVTLNTCAPLLFSKSLSVHYDIYIFLSSAFCYRLSSHFGTVCLKDTASVSTRTFTFLKVQVAESQVLIWSAQYTVICGSTLNTAVCYILHYMMLRELCMFTWTFRVSMVTHKCKSC